MYAHIVNVLTMIYVSVIITFVNVSLKSCCFIGHRDIPDYEKYEEILTEIVTDLIVNKGVSIFFLGSKSDFNDLANSVVSKLKNKYSHIIKVLVRANYEYISDYYKSFLLEHYDDTIFPSRISNAGKLLYVERNQAMIDASDYCVFFYNRDYSPLNNKPSGHYVDKKKKNSGTKIAYNYAISKHKEVINIFDFC